MGEDANGAEVTELLPVEGNNARELPLDFIALVAGNHNLAKLLLFTPSSWKLHCTLTIAYKPNYSAWFHFGYVNLALTDIESKNDSTDNGIAADTYLISIFDFPVAGSSLCIFYFTVVIKLMGSPVKAREWEKTLTVKCRLCGGAKCKRCSESAALAKIDSPVTGLHADWVTDRVLGMMRPSSRLMKEYKIAQQFHKLRITAVFNLTLPGEHPYCGDGLLPSGFPYDPEIDLMAEKIRFFNFGWEDMTTPTLSYMLDLVKVMASVLEDGHQKIAVHCHAGYGRTGIAIACVLIFMHNIAPSVAINIVRRDRPGSVQTSGQAKFVHKFHEYINASNVVFAIPCIHERFTVAETIEQQNRMVHGERTAGTRLSLPKILDFLCHQVEMAAEEHPLQVAYAFVNHIPLHQQERKSPSDLRSIQEGQLKAIFEATGGSENWSNERRSLLAARTASNGKTGACSTTPPPVPSQILPPFEQISANDLFPVKVAFNVGEWNWHDAADLCPTVAFHPALLLDWLEHLLEPLLEQELIDLILTRPDDQISMASCKALNQLPIIVVKSLDRVLRCLRVLQKKIALVDGAIGVNSSVGTGSGVLSDALCVRTAMALFHINNSSPTALPLRSYAECVALLATEWQAPRKLELNIESLQKLGKAPSLQKLPTTTVMIGSGSPIKPLEPAAPRTPKSAGAEHRFTLDPVIQPHFSLPLNHQAKKNEESEPPLTSSPAKMELPSHHHQHQKLAPESQPFPLKAEQVMAPKLPWDSSTDRNGDFISDPTITHSPLRVSPATKDSDLPNNGEELSPMKLTQHTSSTCSLPSVRVGDRYKTRPQST